MSKIFDTALAILLPSFMSKIFDTEAPAMPSLSYQERSLYGALFVELAVFIPYFVLIHTGHPSLNLIAGAVFLIIVAQIILQTIIAIASRNRMTDERDRLIELRGYRAGYFAIVTLMLFGIGTLWLYAVSNAAPPDHMKYMALHFVSVFFGMLMLAEIIKTLTQLVSYRRAL
jgi:hypothetical protein